MSEYLSKEEIKQWRSSLEKITLEEYAARLGKKIEEDKPTNDLIDIVLHGQPVVSNSDEWVQPKTERITTIAQRAFDREQEISPSPFSISKLKLSISDSDKTEKASEPAKKTAKTKETPRAEVKKVAKPKAKTTKTKVSTKTKTVSKKTAKTVKEVLSNTSTGDSLRDEVRVVFKKALTDREQRVFDHFAANKNQIVYAKDLAALLDLPRDYVYKYIKNLRAKIEGDKLQNADKGGFILHV